MKARFSTQAVVGSVLLISAAYFYAAAIRSITHELWMDEVLSVSVARAATLADGWDAIWKGIDFCPPTFDFLLHGLAKYFPVASSPLIWRIPSIIATYSSAICIYVLVRALLNDCAATVAFGMILASPLFDFAVQARPYALLTAAFAGALLIWGTAGTRSFGKLRAGGLWLSLVAGVALHFYGIIEVTVVAIAELLYMTIRGHCRYLVWSAIGLTVPVEMVIYPLARHLSAFNAEDTLAPDYFGRPTLVRLGYGTFEAVFGGSFGVPLLVVAISLIFISYFLQRRGIKSSDAQDKKKSTSDEKFIISELIIVSLSTLPIITFLFSYFITKSFSLRYMIEGCIIPAIAVPFLLDRGRTAPIFQLILVPIIVLILIQRAFAPDPATEVLNVLHASRDQLPIVVGEGLLYIELMEAADPSLGSRLVYLLKEPGSESPDPTNEHEVVRLAELNASYRVRDQSGFLDNHRDFYVLTRPAISTDTTTPSLIAKALLNEPQDEGNGILLFRARH